MRGIKLRGPVVLVLGVLVGVGATLFVAQRGDDDDAGDQGASSTLDPVVTTAPPLPDTDGPPPSERARAAGSARAVVEGFLQAEQDENFEVSFDYLSSVDRSTFGSGAGWVADHADLVPPVRGFTVEEVAEGPDRAEVRALVRYEPSLDEVVGLVPGQTRTTYVVTKADGVWGVDLETSTTSPIFPPDTDAPADVREWVEARQDCRNEGERTGQLQGSPALADELCETEGAVEVGEVSALTTVDGSSFSAAFGEDVLTWARVVDVRSPRPLRAVVGPIGEEWEVIGVLPQT